LKYLKFFIDKFEEIICGVLLTIIIVLLAWSVTGRFVFYRNWAWHEEVIRLCFVYMILFGLALGAKSEAHIRVTILVDYIPEIIRRWIVLLSDIIWIAFNIGTTIASFTLLESMTKFVQETAALSIPEYKIYYVIPFALILTTIRIIQVYIRRYKKTGNLLVESLG